jgi:hypothetical protein
MLFVSTSRYMDVVLRERGYSTLQSRQLIHVFPTAWGVPGHQITVQQILGQYARDKTRIEIDIGFA